MSENNFIEFDGKIYAIDVKKLFSYISKSTNEVKDKVKVERWGYDMDDEESDFKVLNKEIQETISDGSETFGNIRYDFLKNLLNLILAPIADETGGIMKINNLEDFLFGQLFKNSRKRTSYIRA